MATTFAKGVRAMRDLALQFPDQLSSGFLAGHALSSELDNGWRSVIVAGMGGSAIAGDLMESLVHAETDRFLTVNRGPFLPQASSDGTVVVLASYSGNTWETLAAFADAGKRGAHRVVVSSGGRLSELAAEEGVPCLVVPSGLPPRSAVGHMFGGLLGLLDTAFPESNDGRLARAVHALEGERRGLVAATGGPARVARAVGNRTPIIYAESGFAGLARRWKTQIEENAKRLSHFDVLPELFHNAVVPWDAIGRTEASRRAVILIEWSQQDPRLRARFRYLENLLHRRGVTVARVPLRPRDRLAALLSGVWWGDFTSLALAETAEVDPYQVAALEEMKRRLKGR
jgi:glucose/mannose-6-phosphate isomerase